MLRLEQEFVEGHGSPGVGHPTTHTEVMLDRSSGGDKPEVNRQFDD
jgi:hypothetical protein